MIPLHHSITPEVTIGLEDQENDTAVQANNNDK